MLQGGERIAQDLARHPRIEFIGQRLHAAVGRHHQGQVGRLAGGAQFGRQAGRQPGAQGLAGNHDALALVAFGKFGPDRTHVGTQLLLALDLAAALAETAVVEHHHVEIQFAERVQVDEPLLQVAGIAVQEKHHATRVRQSQLGGRQARARHVNEGFMHVGIGRERVVVRQRIGFEQQPLLAKPEPADRRRIDRCKRQQAGQEEDHISHDAACDASATVVARYGRFAFCSSAMACLPNHGTDGITRACSHRGAWSARTLSVLPGGLRRNPACRGGGERRVGPGRQLPVKRGLRFSMKARRPST